MAKLIFSFIFYLLIAICFKGIMLVHEAYDDVLSNLQLLILDAVSVGVAFLAIEGYVSVIQKFIKDDNIQEQKRDADNQEMR